MKKSNLVDEMVRCIVNTMNMSLSKFWEMVKDREAWHAEVRGVCRGSDTSNGTATCGNEEPTE